MGGARVRPKTQEEEETALDRFVVGVDTQNGFAACLPACHVSLPISFGNLSSKTYAADYIVKTEHQTCFKVINLRHASTA